MFLVEKLCFYYKTQLKEKLYTIRMALIPTDLIHYSYLNFAELCSHDYHFGEKKWCCAVKYILCYQDYLNVIYLSQPLQHTIYMLYLYLLKN